MADPGQLYIRWSQTGSDDNRTDPGPAVWWLSASLAIYNPADPMQDTGLAVTGADQKIRVNVDTLLTKSNVGVQVWVCAYGTTGAPFLASALGETGLQKELDDAVPPQPYTATAGAQLSVDLPWTPDESDLTSLGLAATDDLHVCLLANCYATPTGVAPDGQEIVGPGRPVIDVPGNRHHAQRNTTLRGVAAGAGGMGMQMFAGNPDPEGERVFLLHVIERRLEAIGPEELEVVRNSRWGKTLGERPELRPAREPAQSLEIAIGGQTGGELEVPLTAKDPQRLGLRYELGRKEEDVVRVFDVIQRDGDRVVGGARVVTLGVPDDVFGELATSR